MKIDLPFIGQELSIATTDVEELLIPLILDRQIDGKIDQINQILSLNQE